MCGAYIMIGEKEKIMDMKLADRLQDVRKKHGFSQEELADKLDVSRQAVSKWERGEASPDTENLIALSKIYKISIDELINGEESNFIQSETKVGENEKPKKTIVEEDDNDDDDDEPHLSPKQKLVISIVSGTSMLFATIIYFVLGFCFNLWHPAWIVFLILPFAASLADAIVKKNAKNFAMPVVIVAIYLLLGFLTGSWHPYWILFMFIPIYYIIFDAVETFKKDKKEK